MPRSDPSFDQWTGSARDAERERFTAPRRVTPADHSERSALVGGRRLVTVQVDLDTISTDFATSIAHVLRFHGIEVPQRAINEAARNACRNLCGFEVEP